MHLALAASAAAALAVAGGGLRQVQCVSPTGAGCTRGAAIGRPTGVVAFRSTVYVRSGVGSLGSLGVFARDPRSGRLRQLQCVARHAARCTDGRGLETPAALAVSRDGRSVYVAAANGRSLGVYARAADGRLSPRGSVTGLAHPSSVAVSPDGRSVYVGGDRLWVFARAASGALSRVAVVPVGASAVAVSPDGRSVYAAAGGGAHGTLAAFDRDPATGALTQRAAVSSPAARGIEQPSQLVATAGGVFVAAAVSGAVARFDPSLRETAVARGLPLAAGIAVGSGRVYAAYRDGVAVLAADLRRRGTARLPHTTGVAVAGRAVYAASTFRLTVFSTA